MKGDKKFPPNHLLSHARTERGWSQAKLAELLETSPVTISRWENGVTFPSPYFRQRLSKHLQKSIAELGLMPLEHDTKIVSILNLRNPFFTGREALLALLHKRLSTTRIAALTPAQALYGLGGIGKSQTAAEYAYRYAEEYTGVYWIRAATRELLIADFVRLAERLDIAEQHGQDTTLIVAAVKRWLESHQDWLLILDNADDLLMAQEFLPQTRSGYVLLTTRAQASGAIAESVEVEKLDLFNGILLLLRQSKLLQGDALLESVQPEERAAAERIVHEMDGLPLAIAQVGAYLEETGRSITDYLDLYATHRKELLAHRSQLFLNYDETVYTTWSLSFQQIEQQSPVAADVLRLCAFLAPDAIPEELLTQGASVLDDALRNASTDPLRLDEVLKVLRNYSLVRRNGNTHMLSMHRLVQAVLKEWMEKETQRAWAERTVRVVNAAFPKGDNTKDEDQQYYLQYYVPHIQYCATLIEQYELDFPEAIQLLFSAATFLSTYGFYTLSQTLHEQVLAIRRRVLGTDEHLDVAESLNALAILARVQDRYQQSEELHRQVLAIREKLLEPEHPMVAQSLNNLGVLYRNQGRYELAEPLLQRALDIRRQTLGGENPSTLLTHINLAHLYIERREYDSAERILEQTHSTIERALGPEAPLLARNLHLMARIAYERGKYAAAEQFWRHAIEILENKYDSEHPTLVEHLDSLAKLSLVRNNVQQARMLWQRAFSISENTLGPEHPETMGYSKRLCEMPGGDDSKATKVLPSPSFQR